VPVVDIADHIALDDQSVPIIHYGLHVIPRMRPLSSLHVSAVRVGGIKNLFRTFLQLLGNALNFRFQCLRLFQFFRNTYQGTVFRFLFIGPFAFLQDRFDPFIPALARIFVPSTNSVLPSISPSFRHTRTHCFNTCFSPSR